MEPKWDEPWFKVARLVEGMGEVVVVIQGDRAWVARPDGVLDTMNEAMRSDGKTVEWIA